MTIMVTIDITIVKFDIYKIRDYCALSKDAVFFSRSSQRRNMGWNYSLNSRKIVYRSTVKWASSFQIVGVHKPVKNGAKNDCQCSNQSIEWLDKRTSLASICVWSKANEKVTCSTINIYVWYLHVCNFIPGVCEMSPCSNIGSASNVETWA